MADFVGTKQIDGTFILLNLDQIVCITASSDGVGSVFVMSDGEHIKTPYDIKDVEIRLAIRDAPDNAVSYKARSSKEGS